MSAVRGLAPPSLAAPVVVGDDEYVVPEHLAVGNASRGPRFGDDVWDFRPFVPRTARHTRCRFSTLPDEIAVHTVKEYLYSRLLVEVARRHRPAQRAVAAYVADAVVAEDGYEGCR